MRFAKDRISELFLPWDSYKKLDPQRGNWVGRSEQEWLDHNDAVKAQMLRAFPEQHRGHVIQYLKNLDNPSMGYVAPDRVTDNYIKAITADEGYSDIELRKAMKSVLSNPDAEFLPVTYNVPHTKADEEISQAALALSGYKNVRPANAGLVDATDLRADIGPDRNVGVDAQARFTTAKDLNMPVVNNVGNIWNSWINAPGDMYGIDWIHDVINQSKRRGVPGVKRHQIGRPDKLLETSNDEYRRGTISRHELLNKAKDKEYLITAAYPNQGGSLTSPRAKKPTGPYDRTKSQDIKLIDLLELRKLLGKSTLDQLADQDINVNRRFAGQNKLVFNIPDNVLAQLPMGDSDGLNPDIVRQLTMQ